MMIKSIKKARKLTGKRVLLRADFNVPLKNGKIIDDYKILQQLPTIKYLLKKQSKIIIVTHLGRPAVASFNKEFSTKLIVAHLAKLLNKKVKHINSCIGFAVGNIVSKMKNKDIIMLENIRFEKGEIENGKGLAKNLALLADIYVNEAFAVNHRAHASVSAIKSYLPSYAGLFLEQEIIHLNKILRPRKPLVIIIGGAKITTKIPLINRLHKKAFRILIGGILANNFLAAHKFEVGRSLVDEKSIKFARAIIGRQKKNKKIILPKDVIVSNKQIGGEARVRNVNKVKKLEYIYDIGPETIRLYAEFVKKASTIIWNGPMGMFEENNFKYGTLSIARLVAARSKGKAFGVVGGGETVEALKITKMSNYVDWVSTGGGAMLTYLGGGKMPGLKGIVYV